jgi:hypothetical protein
LVLYVLYCLTARDPKIGATKETMMTPTDTDYRAGRTGKEEHREGKVARAIEEQTAKLPSDTFLWAAVASMAASAVLKLMNKDSAANFVGQWSPTLLILGLYNKVVKLNGSDRTEEGQKNAA